MPRFGDKITEVTGGIPVLGSPTECLKDLDRSLDPAVDLFAENATFEFP